MLYTMFHMCHTGIHVFYSPVSLRIDVAGGSFNVLCTQRQKIEVKGAGKCKRGVDGFGIFNLSNKSSPLSVHCARICCFVGV
jgi:hypothetical protein